MSDPELQNSSAETPSQSTTIPKDEGPSALRELARLYTLDESDTSSAEPDESPQDGKPPAKKGPPKNLDQLAETLGVEVKDLYGLELPSSKRKGEKFTLGQLKDQYEAREEFTVAQLAFEEERSGKESELLRAQNELQELFATLPEAARKPEVLERVRAKHEALLVRERKATLDAIPEWKDVETRTQEIAEIVEYLKGYGFPANYLKSVYDHRSMRFIREAWRREARLRKALEHVTEQKPNALGKSKPAGNKPTRTAAKGFVPRSEQQMRRYLDAVK